ncbi:MAG: hypothetical protein NTX73_15665 [Rhodobacterales bacterium]|nr:hypothetical protein [Rhodobacterales bacterium]
MAIALFPANTGAGRAENWRVHDQSSVGLIMMPDSIARGRRIVETVAYPAFFLADQVTCIRTSQPSL